MTGSYGGFLTAMLRLNHPDTFDGAIASGAPLHLTAALFPNNTEQYVSAKWVSLKKSWIYREAQRPSSYLMFIGQQCYLRYLKVSRKENQQHMVSS